MYIKLADCLNIMEINGRFLISVFLADTVVSRHVCNSLKMTEKSPTFL